MNERSIVSRQTLWRRHQVVGATTTPIADAISTTLADHTGTGSLGKKIGDLPTSGTGDWTADEKADILAALGVTGTGLATTRYDALYRDQEGEALMDRILVNESKDFLIPIPESISSNTVIVDFNPAGTVLAFRVREFFSR